MGNEATPRDWVEQTLQIWGREGDTEICTMAGCVLRHKAEAIAKPRIDMIPGEGFKGQ